MPVLQYCSPEQLQIDQDYQRTLETGPSKTLIRRIAMFWDWGLCQPLIVARRADGGLYVVDGQHRLEAAKLRGDIWQLPCVVASYANAAEEAASFVALNQNRRPLGALDIFKAALLAGDEAAVTIRRALEETDLELARTSNNQCMAPGAVGNIGGLQRCLREHGETVLVAALDVLSQSYKGQVLRYGGSIFPGIAAIVAKELKRFGPGWRESEMFGVMTEMVGGAAQAEWVKDIHQAIGEDPLLRRAHAAARVFEKAWAECSAELLDEAA